MLPDNTRFIVADTETTGIDENAAACEVGWVEIDQNFNIIEEVESIIDPQVMISPTASGVHGLVNADCEAFPNIEEFFSEDDPSCYGKKIEGPVVLIGHRISFDVRFLGPYVPDLRQELCTLRWVRKLYPDSDDHKLSTMNFALGLPRSAGAHRVMADVYSAMHLTRHLCERTGMSLKELAEASAQPMEVTYMPFGKHRGDRVADVPKAYLRWAMGAMDNLDPDLLHTFELHLNKKKEAHAN